MSDDNHGEGGCLRRVMLGFVLLLGLLGILSAVKQEFDKRDYWIQDLRRRIAVLEQEVRQ